MSAITDEQVEHCAKAVFAWGQSEFPRTDGSTWENVYPEARDEVRKIVRVVLEALSALTAEDTGLDR